MKKNIDMSAIERLKSMKSFMHLNNKNNESKNLDEDKEFITYECPNCGKYININDEYIYCPECGAIIQ